MLSLLVVHLTALLGQAADVSPINWGTVLNGAIGSSPVAAVALLCLSSVWAENKRLQKQLDERHDEALQLAERVFPALIQATGALTDFKATMDASRPGSHELGQLLRELQRITDDLGRGDRRGQQQ